MQYLALLTSLWRDPDVTFSEQSYTVKPVLNGHSKIDLKDKC